MAKPLQNALNWVYEKFSKDPSKMLIWTGVAGWTLSSVAQVGAILFNRKIPDEQKGFLVPQEMADAAVNIASFFLITQGAKLLVSKLFSTGKFAPKKVRQYLMQNKDIYANKIGKLDFDLGKELKNKPVFNEYNKCKRFGEIVTTVGAGVVASNIVTPIIRNRMASNMQKNYISKKQNEYPSVYVQGMKI